MNGLELFLISTTGGTPIQITSDQYTCSYPAWSPDGKSIAYCGYDAQYTPGIYLISSGGGTATRITNQGVPYLIAYPSWSADGAYIAFAGYDAQEVPSVYLASTSTGFAVQVPLGGRHARQPQVSPYLKAPPIKLIGTGGILGSNAAGFIISQSGAPVNTVVTFDTGHATLASRNAARVTTQTGNGAQPPSNLIFTVTSNDGLTSLKFTNGTSASGVTTVVGSGGSVNTATSAIVSFDGKTGLVAMAFTYNAIRAYAATPEIHGDEVTYNGSISSVVDEHGINIAPNGASSVTLNSKTGQLVRFK